MYKLVTVTLMDRCHGCLAIALQDSAIVVLLYWVADATFVLQITGTYLQALVALSVDVTLMGHMVMAVICSVVNVTVNLVWVADSVIVACLDTSILHHLDAKVF